MVGQLMNEGRYDVPEFGCLHQTSDSLEIRRLELIKSKFEAENANISIKSNIKKLTLIWDSDENSINHEEVLDGLYPNHNLRHLAILGYGGEKFPPWLMRIDASQKSCYKGGVCNIIKVLELVDCRRCQQLPTLGHLPFLEKLEIKYMETLECIGEEFYSFTRRSSTSTMKSMVYFRSLKQLKLCGLDKISEWHEPGMTSSVVWIGFPSLEVLVIENCPELANTPTNFPSLKQLTMSNINSHLLSNILTNSSSLTSLENLQVEQVMKLAHLPNELTEYCVSLKTLKIYSCMELTYLPESLSNLLSLEELEVVYCPKLLSQPNLSGLGLMREVFIFCNDSLTGTPEGLQNCNSLEKLWLSLCPKVETLPDLTDLTYLSNLCIRGMPKMLCEPPDWLYTLPYLRILHIGTYHEQNAFPDFSHLLNINALEQLNVYGWEKLQSIPEQLQNFTELKGLLIAEFENLECLPDWLGNLSSLQVLHLRGCPKLRELPSVEAMEQLNDLIYIEIENCPLLKETVELNGPEHHKIAAHIQVHITNSSG